jgi:hypothetical protein
MSSRQSADAVKDWLLGTQAAPACEAGAFAQSRLMTADRSILVGWLGIVSGKTRFSFRPGGGVEIGLWLAN